MRELAEFLPESHPIWELLAKYIPATPETTTEDTWSETTTQGSALNFADVTYNITERGNFSRTGRYFSKSAMSIYF
jgi:hypothetical protein